MLISGLCSLAVSNVGTGVDVFLYRSAYELHVVPRVHVYFKFIFVAWFLLTKCTRFMGEERRGGGGGQLKREREREIAR